jgi:hypothetical protein
MACWNSGVDSSFEGQRQHMANRISHRQVLRTDSIDQPLMVIASKNDAVPWSASISQGPTQ